MGRQIPFTKVPTGNGEIDRMQDRLAEALRVLRQSPQQLVTQKGSLVASTGPGAPAEHQVGADSRVLVADSTKSTGLRWAQSKVYAAGPSGADDTAAINAVIAGAVGDVYLPAGSYIVSGAGILIAKSLVFEMDSGATITTAGTSAIVVTASNVTIRGGAIVLQTNASSAQFGIMPSGTVSNLLVERVRITGQGTVPDGTHGTQTGFGNNSGQTLTNIQVHECTITSVNVGISFNADLSGSINGALAEDNHLTSIIGTASGSGYGIHHANGNGTSSYFCAVHNEIDGAQRHSIYQAKGSGFVIVNNRIRNHRTGISTGQNLPGIQVSRSADGVVAENFFGAPVGGAFSANPDISTGAGNLLQNVVYANNVIVNPSDFPPISVGTSAPATDGVPEGLVYSGNVVYNDVSVSGYSGDLIRIWCGKRITFEANNLYWLNATGSGGIISIRGTSEGAGTATYSDDLRLVGNLLYSTNNGGTAFGFFWPAAAATSGIRVDLVNNRIATASNAHTFGAAQTDPNVYVVGGGQGSGLTQTVANLPAAATAGAFAIAYASNGRKAAEGAGAGTGIPTWSDGTNWRTFYDNTVTAA